MNCVVSVFLPSAEFGYSFYLWKQNHILCSWNVGTLKHSKALIMLQCVLDLLRSCIFS